MRGRRLEKLLRALALLSRPQGATVEQLAQEFDMTRRSAYRYLSTLEQNLRLRLVKEKGFHDTQTRYLLPKALRKKVAGRVVPDISFSAQEIIALYLLRGQALALKNTIFEKHINNAFQKLTSLLPSDTCPRLDRLQALFVHTAKFSKDYAGKKQIITGLIQAMLHRETCLVTYHAFGENKVKKYKIDPLHLYEYSGGLYAVVRVPRFGTIRTQAVERIHELQKTGASFDYPKDFDSSTYLAQTFSNTRGEGPMAVRVWFSPDMARYIRERKWSDTDKITRQADGAIILSFAAAGRRDIKKWVLSFGASAELLEPEDLRQEIKTELAASRAGYG